MTVPTETFIRAFEEIAAEVNRRAGMQSAHGPEIEKAADRDQTVRNNYALIRSIRDIRNILQHPKHRSSGAAILISDSFFAEVQGLLNQLRNPPTSNSVGVARGAIRIARVDERLGDLAGEMKRRGFSHLPILDGRDAVMGVFNEAAVFDYLWKEAETIIGHATTVADILPSCRLDAGHTESFVFIRPGTPVDDHTLGYSDDIGGMNGASPTARA